MEAIKNYQRKRFGEHPKLRDVSKIDWIMGGTLTRYCIVGNFPTVKTMVVRELAPDDILLGCDACERRHSPINVRCSRNQCVPTRFNRPNVLYDYQTGKPLAGNWVKVDEEWGPFQVGRETWQIL